MACSAVRPLLISHPMLKKGPGRGWSEERDRVLRGVALLVPEPDSIELSVKDRIRLGTFFLKRKGVKESNTKIERD